PTPPAPTPPRPPPPAVAPALLTDTRTTNAPLLIALVASSPGTASAAGPAPAPTPGAVAVPGAGPVAPSQPAGIAAARFLVRLTGGDAARAEGEQEPAPPTAENRRSVAPLRAPLARTPAPPARLRH